MHSRMKTHNNIQMTNQQQPTNSVLASKFLASLYCLNIQVKVQILMVGLLNMSLISNTVYLAVSQESKPVKIIPESRECCHKLISHYMYLIKEYYLYQFSMQLLLN